MYYPATWRDCLDLPAIASSLPMFCTTHLARLCIALLAMDSYTASSVAASAAALQLMPSNTSSIYNSTDCPWDAARAHGSPTQSG